MENILTRRYARLEKNIGTTETVRTEKTREKTVFNREYCEKAIDTLRVESTFYLTKLL